MPATAWPRPPRSEVVVGSLDNNTNKKEEESREIVGPNEKELERQQQLQQREQRFLIDLSKFQHLEAELEAGAEAEK